MLNYYILYVVIYLYLYKVYYTMIFCSPFQTIILYTYLLMHVSLLFQCNRSFAFVHSVMGSGCQ